MNQGAWYSSQHHMRRVLHKPFPDLYLHYAGREAQAAAAAGYMSLHIQQQEALVIDALTGSVTLRFLEGHHVNAGESVPFVVQDGVSQWALALPKADLARWAEIRAVLYDASFGFAPGDGTGSGTAAGG